MQQGMHNAIDLLNVESQLLDTRLKYHYLIADERIRHQRPSIFAQLVERVHSLLTPRSMTSERGGI